MRAPALTGDSSLDAVIAAYERSTDPSRDVRAALTHVRAELGTMPVRAVRARHVTDLLERLRRSGMSARRAADVDEGVRDVFAFAVARRIIAVDPLGSDARRPQAAGTPTLALVALGARVAAWTAWVVTLGFLLLLAVLVIELG